MILTLGQLTGLQRSPNPTHPWAPVSLAWVLPTNEDNVMEALMNEASDKFDGSVVEVVVDEVRANVLESSASRFVNVMALPSSFFALNS